MATHSSGPAGGGRNANVVPLQTRFPASLTRGSVEPPAVEVLGAHTARGSPAASSSPAPGRSGLVVDWSGQRDQALGLSSQRANLAAECENLGHREIR
jgi:hypothetical protein